MKIKSYPNLNILDNNQIQYPIQNYENINKSYPNINILDNNQIQYPNHYYE